MSRARRISLIAVGAVIFMAAIAVITGVNLVRSGWLEEKIRQRVIADAERATGGKIEIGSLHLDWKTLTAVLNNLTVRGSEPATEAPLLAVKRVVIVFKILSLMEREFDVTRVEADSPRGHVIIQADGSTNLLKPRTPRPVPEIILALKIGTFDLSDGIVVVERLGRKTDVIPWNARGENVLAHVTYDSAGQRYDGVVSVAPVHFVWENAGRSGTQIDAQISATASMEKNRLSVAAATVKAGQSEIDLSNMSVSSFTAPIVTAQYSAKLSLGDADRMFKLVNFKHTGTLNVAGNLRFAAATDYSVTGEVRGSDIGYGKVHGIRVAAKLSATPEKVLVSGLLLDALGGEMLANGEVRNLKDVHLAGDLNHFDARMLASLGGLAPLPYDGILTGPFDATGKLQESNLHQVAASATLGITPATDSIPLRGEVMAKYDGVADTVELGRSWLQLPNTRVDLSGVLGRRLQVQFQSTDLKDLAPLVDEKKLPAALASPNGAVTFNGTVTGALNNPGVAGHATIQNAVYEGQPIDSLSGDFTAMKTQATLNNAVLVSSNLRARVTGSIGLSDWKWVKTSPVNGSVQLTNADVSKLLALAGRKDVPVSGTLNTTAQVSGTIDDPHATADLTLSRGRIYGEPYDSVTGHAQYLNSGTQLLTAAAAAGRKRLNATVRVDFPGRLTFTLSTNAMALGEIALARKAEPSIEGTAQIKADGMIRIDRATSLRDVAIQNLNADLNMTGLGIEGRSLGEAHLNATTNNGVITGRFESNAAKSMIRGDGTVGLTGDYPVNAKLTFSRLGLSAVAALLKAPSAKSGGTKGLNFDGSAVGEVTLNGKAKSPELLTAALDVTQFELHPLSVIGEARNIPNLSLRNNGPIRATLSQSAIRVESAHFQAPNTDFSLSGSIALNSQSPLNLAVKGSVNLALAETYDPDVTSSGELVVDATVLGNYTDPQFSGRGELQKGEFHFANFSNGLTNVKGAVLFNGNRATIQSLTGESGGGKVEVSGFGALTGGLATFRVEAKTQGVRVRYPEGVSSTSDADLTLAGTPQRSEVSGTVTLRRIAINPKSDVSNILATAAQPMKTSASSQGFLANMNLDIQIETAPDVAFETSVAQSLDADANLRLRGTAETPAVLGRINITQGELAFFGNKYIINQGTISFFNPAKIDPILNIDLQTKSRGVEVTLTVIGPINKLNVSYRSDPPLQFSDIVALLATGRSPTDPTLAARDTGESQNLQQMGASALIGQAIQNSGGGRLQRFFGVSKIKIDPQLTGITGSPEARLTMEQQVSPDILFTYITDVSSTSTQLIRVEWDFSRKWAAILTREENGYVGVDFAYKKRFK